MSDYGGGFNSGDTPSRGGSSDGKPRRNYDEQTLIPVTIKMILSALGDPNAGGSGGGGGDLSLKDGRALHMVKLVAAVRNSEERSTNVFIDVEDGTGFTQVKVWVNEGDDCSAITQLRSAACQDCTYIRIIGQVRDFDGTKQIVANDVRPVSTGNELTYHFLEVAHSYEKHIKSQQSGGGGVAGGMGYGIGNIASGGGAPRPQAGGGISVGAQGGGGGGLNEAVIESIKALGAMNDSGANVDHITSEVSSKHGYSADDIRNAINHLSNEGHIYSTIDENHFLYAE